MRLKIKLLAMEENIGRQVADLINRRNELTKKHYFDDIIALQDNFVLIMDGSNLVACAEVKQVQWYQHEICHVSVHESYEGTGKGNEILRMAEQKALNKNARVIQCTIREANKDSIRLFTRNNYRKVNDFYNVNSGNLVGIWQKVLTSNK